MPFSEVEKRQVRHYWRRKSDAEKLERVKNDGLPAGSPMYYYCRFCGTHVATLPETHREPAPTICVKCKWLDNVGLMPPPSLEEIGDGVPPA